MDRRQRGDRRPYLDGNVLALDVPGLGETLLESGKEAGIGVGRREVRQPITGMRSCARARNGHAAAASRR
jgi:hypothetical protein